VNRTRFSRNDRLTRPAEFQRVFSHPVKIGSRLFTVLARPNELDHARLGIAVSKKNVRKAVARNRIKRIIRESFRMMRDQLGALDIVVIARRGADGESRGTLRDTLNEQWIRLAKECVQ
jgi:ribonuclease P protein component